MDQNMTQYSKIFLIFLKVVLTFEKIAAGLNC